jgi:type II secretory pathway pseudopilin PulG
MKLRNQLQVFWLDNPFKRGGMADHNEKKSKPMKTDVIDGPREPRTQFGFTLIELGVVIAMIALLAALLLPALARAGVQDQAVQCMNNCTQLIKAWTMYSSDNKDRCVNNYGITQTEYDEQRGLYNTWCLDVMDWTSNPQNTNTSLLLKALLGPYMGTSASAFKCPADNYLSSAQISAGFSERVRSYSMNDFVGLFSDCPDCGDGGPGTGVDYTFQSKNEFNTSWPQYLTLAAIPQPATIYIFVDEHPDSINDGYFSTGTQTPPDDLTPQWSGSDTPASYHNGAGGFAFSDGHSEIHQWLNPKTITPINPAAFGNGPTPPGPGGANGSFVDRAWLCAHACIQ